MRSYARAPLIRAVVHATMRWYPLVLLVGIGLGALAYPQAKQLYSHIDTDMANLLPDDSPSVRELKKLREKFRVAASLIIVLEADTPDKGRAALLALTGRLKKDPTVGEVDFEKPGYHFFNRHKLLFLDREDLETVRDRLNRRIQREKLGSLYIDFGGDTKDEPLSFDDLEEKYRSKYTTGVVSRYHTSEDERVYSIYVKSATRDEGLSALKGFYHHVREEVEAFRAEHGDSTLQVYYSGPVRTRVEEYHTLIHDLIRAGIISAIGIAVVLFLYLRRVAAVIILMLPVGLGILISFGITAMVIHDLNLVTSFLFAILGGLGVEVGIHLFTRYLEERRRGASVEKALFHILQHTGASALTSVMTVAATFFVLTINDFKGFSEFGFIAGVGLVVNYLCYMLFLPSLLVAAEKLKLLALHRPIGLEMFHRPHARAFPWARPMLTAMGIIIVAAIILFPRLEFEWRFSTLKAMIPEAQLAREKQRLTTASVNSPASVIIHNREEADAIHDVIQKKKQSPDTTISAVKSYFDLVPSDQEEKLEILREIRRLLNDKALTMVKGERRKDLQRARKMIRETTPVSGEGEIPDDVRKIFWGEAMDPAEQVAYINPLPKMELDDGRNAIRFSREVGTLDTEAGTFTPSSDAIVFANVLQTMVRDGKRAVALAFLCVFVIVFLDFRNVRTAATVVLPVVLGVVISLGFMVLFGMKLNFYNMVVLPTAVGTSIDNAVHLYHRHVEHGRRDLLGAWFSTGGAALLSSFTNIFGFLGLLFVNHSGLKTVGGLAVVGLVACLFTTLVFFPAFLQMLDRRRAHAHQP
ncbi:MAG: MMPL family transporter [Deltaproteobacteria bacterium]|nr:MMPL family transporter [Deltaproteobacteria bacterium]